MGGVLLLTASVRWMPAHGAYHEVIEQLSAKIAGDPLRGDLLFRRAGVHLDHEDTGACLADLDRVERVAPGKFPTDLLRGEALLKAGEPARAMIALDRFLAHEPPGTRALTARARTLAALGETAASIADYRSAVALSEHPEPDLVQEFADALSKAGQSAEAAEALGKAIAVLGPVPSLVLRSINAEIARGDWDAALARIESMRQAAPRPEPWMAQRARVLLQAGRAEESRTAWRTLLAHLASLPNLERGSTAMSRLAAEAETALSQTAAAVPLTTATATP